MSIEALDVLLLPEVVDVFQVTQYFLIRSVELYSARPL